MDLLVIGFTFFILGILAGTVGVVTATIYVGKKSLDKDKASKASVTDRLAKVRAITKDQLELQAIAGQPQKNGLDGKYKNSLSSKIKEMEEEKVVILKSILEDGHDPEVTVQGSSGALEKMKLSEFLIQQGYHFEPKSKVEQATQPKKNPFTVVKGGKGDDNGDGQTFH